MPAAILAGIEMQAVVEALQPGFKQRGWPEIHIGVGITVGENTRNVAADFIYRELDHVRVKGKDRPVAIYQPIGLAGEASDALHDEIKLFHEMRHLYRVRDWDQAQLRLADLQRISPGTVLYRIYAERISYYRKNPPVADWDGVFVFQDK